jgi:putative transcriptional regulator
MHHNLKPIRERLGVTQKELADGLGCSQGNVANLEAGQTLRPGLANRLIAFAETKGHKLTFEDIYAQPREEQTAKAA